MSSSYGDQPTRDLYARLLAAIARLIGMAPDLPLLDISPSFYARHHHLGDDRQRFQCQTGDGIAGLLQWADVIGARWVVVNRGDTGADGSGRSWMHLHVFGDLDGVPVVIFTGLSADYDASTLPTGATIWVDDAGRIDRDPNLSPVGKVTELQRAATLPGQPAEGGQS